MFKLSFIFYLGFISDKTNRILGWTTLRQLRVKPSLLSIDFRNFKSEICFDFQIPVDWYHRLSILYHPVKQIMAFSMKKNNHTILVGHRFIILLKVVGLIIQHPLQMHFCTIQVIHSIHIPILALMRPIVVVVMFMNFVEQ